MPASISSLAMSVYPLNKVTRNIVLMLSLTSAPASISSLVVSVCPPNAAHISAVQLPVNSSTSAPASISSLTVAVRPHLAAHISAVSPSLSTALTLKPALINRLTVTISPSPEGLKIRRLLSVVSVLA